METTFVVHVEDQPGVLNRVTSLFRRRCYNIVSLNVGRTHEPGVSRMTFAVEADVVIGDEVVALAGDQHVVVAVGAQLHGAAKLLREQRGDAGETSGNFGDEATAAFFLDICYRLVRQISTSHKAEPPLPTLNVL